MAHALIEHLVHDRTIHRRARAVAVATWPGMPVWTRFALIAASLATLMPLARLPMHPTSRVALVFGDMAGATPVVMAHAPRFRGRHEAHAPASPPPHASRAQDIAIAHKTHLAAVAQRKAQAEKQARERLETARARQAMLTLAALKADRPGTAHQFMHVDVIDGRTLSVDGAAVRLAGLAPPDPTRLCPLPGHEPAPCAQRAASVLDLLTRWRAIRCSTVNANGPYPEMDCRIGKTNLAKELIRRGLARAAPGQQLDTPLVQASLGAKALE